MVRSAASPARGSIDLTAPLLIAMARRARSAKGSILMRRNQDSCAPGKQFVDPAQYLAPHDAVHRLERLVEHDDPRRTYQAAARRLVVAAPSRAAG